MQGHATWKAGYESQLDDGRGHRVTVDLEEEEGGTDRGTSALELCVLSLAGCITTIFALVAHRRRLAFEGLRVDLEAARPRGSRTITAVEGTARVVTTAPAAEVETALQITLRTCPVGVLFDQANVPVRVRAVLVEPGAPSAGPPA